MAGDASVLTNAIKLAEFGAMLRCDSKGAAVHILTTFRTSSGGHSSSCFAGSL